MVGVTVPIIPMAHQYLFTEPIEGVHPGLPQLRDPDNLVYFREEVGGPVHGRLRARPGAVVARRDPARLQRQAPGARHGALRADHGRRHPARPGDGRRGRQPGHQRPRGLHAGQRVHPRRVGRPRLLRGGRVLGPRHRRRGRDRAPDGDLDRRRRARARPLEDGHPAVRAGLSEPGVHARPVDRELRDLLRHPLPERGAPGRPPAADLADLRRARGSRRGVRREVGLGAAELVRDRTPPAGDEALRPRGWAGEHWSPAIGAEALATRHGRRPVRRDARSPRSRSSVRAPSPSCRRCAPTTWTCRSGGSSTRSCSTGAAGSSAT